MIKAGDYCLATKYKDGDPKDQWAVGFYAGTFHRNCGDRYFLVDEHGKDIRANGFRRIKKISKERGEWILNNSYDIENGTKSLWWWIKQRIESTDFDVVVENFAKQMADIIDKDILKSVVESAKE